MDFKHKNILVFGLGILGGGVSTVNWLLTQKAKITVTDLKTKAQLKDSISKIKGKVLYSLGGHNSSDIDNNDMVVVNPDVSINNKFIQYAKSKNKIIINEATIFFNQFRGEIIGITGTRGKTTTTNWTNHFTKSKFKSVIVGNSTNNQFLKILSDNKKFDIAVAETPSFHLEFFNSFVVAPHIVIVTNVFQDHLNRHGDIKNYARVKANLFLNQKKQDHLILNLENKFSQYFKRMKPKGNVWYFSTKPLKNNYNGVYFKDDSVFFQKKGKSKRVVILKNFVQNHGKHNLENLLAAVLAANLAGCLWTGIEKKIKSLPQIKFRQEIIYKNNELKVINDTTATSPDGGVAAVRLFGSENCVLIAGGTDRNLDFKDWVKEVNKNIKPGNLILISGSATNKMLELGLKSKYKPFDSLKECLKTALKVSGKYAQSVILFSPASKSFEKFKNEYDRGEQFNSLVFNIIKK